MESALQEINAVAGVNGSFACISNGQVISQAMPDSFDSARLTALARLATQTFNALELSRQHVTEVDLVFEQQRLALKNLRGGILVILCERNINLPLLNMIANNAIESLAASLSGANLPAPAPSAAMPAAATAQSAATLAPSSDLLAANSLYLDLEKESRRIIDAASSEQVRLCVMDPIALWARLNTARARVAQPQKRHMDFLARSNQANLAIRLFERLGYQPNQRFNASRGTRYLNFYEPGRLTSINVFLDAYDMYHRVDLTSVLAQNETLMTETGLTLIRLQLVEITNADLNELAALFLEHELSAGSEKGKIDATQITRICADDWGWYRTITMNLDKLQAFVAKERKLAPEALITERLGRLRPGIDAAPKSLRWQTRARIGDSVRWYETPQISGIGTRPDLALG